MTVKRSVSASFYFIILPFLSPVFTLQASVLYLFVVFFGRLLKAAKIAQRLPAKRKQDAQEIGSEFQLEIQRLVQLNKRNRFRWALNLVVEWLVPSRDAHLFS